MSWLKCLAVGIAYYLLARISFLTALPGAPAGPALAWLPTGFAVAALLTEGYRIWPGILLGSVLNSYPSTVGWGAVMGFAMGNTVDALLAAWLPCRALGRRIDFHCSKDVVVFILTTVFVSSAFSATAGTVSLWWSGQEMLGNAGETWLVWWVSDFLSVLILAPMLVAWRSKTAYPAPRASALEIGGAAVAAGVLLAVLFSMPLGRDTLHFVYWLVPLLIWCGFRLNLRFAGLCLFLLATCVIGVTSVGVGPFAAGSAQESFLYVQSFLTVASVLCLLMVSAVTEREQAIQVRDDFFLLASHEVKTPLAILGMQSHFLKELLDDGALGRLSPEQRREMLRINSKELRRLGDLVDDLLEGARIVAGKLEINPEPFDLADLVREQALAFSDAQKESGSEVRVQASGAKGSWDRRKLGFVLKTLLKNALKYGDGKPVDIRLSTDSGFAVIEVEDHGVGMAKEQLAKIFDRFGQCASPRSFGGLGQGLFISSAVVEAHKGKIRVASELGRGTKFRVELPLPRG